MVIAFAPPPDWLGRPNYQQVLDEHKLRARALEDALKHSGVLDGVTHGFEMIGGDPAESIATVGRVRNAEEIVVGSRGFGPVRAAPQRVPPPAADRGPPGDRDPGRVPDTRPGVQLRDAIRHPDRARRLGRRSGRGG